MDLMWSLILVLCRPLLDDGLLQLSYFCGGILSNIMLEWSDDRKLQSYGKQYLLDKLVDISCLTLGHGCKLTNRRLWILFCNKFIFGLTFFHWFFFSLNMRQSWANFILTVTLKIRKLYHQSHVQVNLDVISVKVKRFCTFCCDTNIFKIVSPFKWLHFLSGD